MRATLMALGILIGSTGTAQAPFPGCQNIDCVLAAVPMPALTATQVVAIAQQRLGSATYQT